MRDGVEEMSQIYSAYLMTMGLKEQEGFKLKGGVKKRPQ